MSSAKPKALLHCRYQRQLFPDQRWWDVWQHLLGSGDRDAAARPMVEALYVAPFELVLAFLEQAHNRQNLALSGLQQRFRIPPSRSALTDPVIPRHLLASYDSLLPGAPLSSCRSGPAAAAQTAETRSLSQPLAAARSAG